MTTSTREEILYKAKTTKQTESFEDMLDAMNKVVAAKPDLTVEERNCCQLPTRTPSDPEEPHGEPSLPSKRSKNRRNPRKLTSLEYTRTILKVSSTNTAIRSSFSSTPSSL